MRELALYIQQQQKDQARRTQTHRPGEPAPKKHLIHASIEEDEKNLQESTALKVAMNP